MTGASREFQVFAKPAGALCNLGCDYCYYLEKQRLYPPGESFRMPDGLLEEYIVQHINACTEPVISFSWHGGEPTILGLDYFRTIVMLQQRHQPAGRRIVNGLQTNGTLLDDDWCRFLAAEHFAVGISLDGPQDMHDRYRATKDRHSVFAQAMRGYQLLQRHRVPCEILCVVSSYNVRFPSEVYRFFRQLGAAYLSFLPLVERRPQAEGGVSDRTVPAEAWGAFLCTIFDEWAARDIGQVKVQIFEEAVRPAFGQEHTLCVFQKVCGGVPVVEHNGDFYCCDHFVDAEHRLGNIRKTPLVELLDSPAQQAFGRAKLDTLPRCCQACEVRAMCNGACPKDRFLTTPEGEPGLNYLCAGYRQFFHHCQPFVAQVSALWRQPQQQAPAPPAVVKETALRVGRNDPCPCGSGKKYKNCCFRR